MTPRRLLHLYYISTERSHLDFGVEATAYLDFEQSSEGESGVVDTLSDIKLGDTVGRNHAP